MFSSYFGDRFSEWLTAQGAKVTTLVASAPGTFPLDELSKLDLRRFKCATVTHVDTSTAVVAPVQRVTALLRAANPNIVVCVDSVAGLGGETLRMTEWDIDYVMTGSQKALGVPAGLCISVARPRALEAAKKRKTPVETQQQNIPLFSFPSDHEKKGPLFLCFVGKVVSHYAKLHGRKGVLFCYSCRRIGDCS